MAIYRYLDSLHLKASEMFALETKAKFIVAEDIAKNVIIKNLDIKLISDLTGLSLERIEELRNEIKK